MSKSVFSESVFLFLTLAFVFVLSINLAPYFINGDQVHYIRIYNGLAGLSLSEGYGFYKANIDSREPVYFLLSWISTNFGIEKNYFITLLNVFLAYFAYRYLNKIGGHPFIAFLIISFSYYSLVLFFSAERLKIGFLILLLALNYSKKSRFYLLLSVFAHAQMIIFIVSASAMKIRKDVSRFFSDFIITRKFLFFIISFIPVAFIVFVSMQEHLFSKFNSYYEFRNVFELFKLFLLFAMSCVYAKNRKDVVAFFIPLFLFAFIFGGERVNILGFLAFLYFSIHYKRGFNLGVLLLMLYFLYTGFYFMLNIIEYGNGFYRV